MKIALTNPIEEEDVTRTSITITHMILYPEDKLVIYNKDGSNKSFPVGGLSDATIAAYSALLTELRKDIRGEYDDSVVTKRLQAKIDASEVLKNGG